MDRLTRRGLVAANRLTEYGRKVEVLPVDRPWGELLVHADDHLIPLVSVCASIESLQKILGNVRDPAAEPEEIIEACHDIEEIRIEDLGVIGRAHVPLGPGLTAIMGETGAGKTMVLTGLGLLLGAKADTGAVRPGAEKSVTAQSSRGCSGRFPRDQADREHHGDRHAHRRQEPEAVADGTPEKSKAGHEE